MENIPKFHLGPQNQFTVEVIEEGDPERQTLNFCRVSSPNNIRFEGYVALISVNKNPQACLVFDSGSMKLPDGTIMRGEFSGIFAETDDVQYFFIKNVTGLPWYQQPYIFEGTFTTP